MAAYSSRHNSLPSHFYTNYGGGSAQRAVALDLMLRTFMNSPDFQPNNPRMWEGIAKLVPGTTVQQCIHRWEELRCSSRTTLQRDISSLTAKGTRPHSSSSSHHYLTTSTNTTNTSSVGATHYGGGMYYRHEYYPLTTELPAINSDMPSRHSSSSLATLGGTGSGRGREGKESYRNSLSSGYRLSGSGKFTASFCQTYLNKREKSDRHLVTKATLDHYNRSLLNEHHHTNIDPHTHTAKDSHTHTTSGDSHTRTTSGDPHTNTTRSDPHTTKSDPHTNTTKSDPHTNTTKSDSNTTRSDPHTNTIRNSTSIITNSTNFGGHWDIPNINNKSFPATRSTSDRGVTSREGEEGETDPCVLAGCKSRIPHVVITILDGGKKKMAQFYCARSLLLHEMGYFRESQELKRQHDAVHIGVEIHCDPLLFSWLMTYIKKGTMEGLMGEELSEPLKPPTLSPSNVTSVLPYADFLKVDSLVEECLDYCHEHMNEVLTCSSSNVCEIKNNLLKKLSKRFSPLEVEKLAQEKFKNKIYFHLLERIFEPSYTHPECPSNASGLFKCKHCSRLMIPSQESLFYCVPSRLIVNKMGQIVFSHEKDTQWTVDYYFKSLRDTKLSWRDIFWRIWGKITTLTCRECNKVYQCSSLATCAYHPGHVIPTISNDSGPCTGKYYCCGQLTGVFSSLPVVKNGCTYRDHALLSSQGSVTKILRQLRDVICEGGSNFSPSHPKTHDTLAVILRKESLNNKEEEENSQHKTSTTHHLSSRDSTAINTNSTRPPHTNTTGGCSITKPIYSNTNATSTGLRVYTSTNHSTTCIGTNRANLTIPNKATTSSNNITRLNTTSNINSSRVQFNKKQYNDMSPSASCHPSQRKKGDTGEEMYCEERSEESELEEDEDEEMITNVVPNTEASLSSSQKVKKSKSLLHSKGRHSDKSTVADVDWVWDSHKPVRWNQDMQRSQDEKRIAQLQQQLKQLSHDDTLPPNSNKSNTTATCTTTTDPSHFPGGIFAQLETQFLANVATKTANTKGKQKPFGKFK